MPWARFDERFPGHRRIRRLSDAAFRLHVSAVCWSCEYLTDGHIPPHDLGEVSDVRRPEKVAEELVAAGRWHLPGFICPSEHCDPVDDGWRIHDFLDYNPSRSEVEEKREKDAERKRRGRTSDKRRTPKGVRTESARTHDGVLAESARTDPVVTNVTTTRPDPTPLASVPDPDRITGAHVVDAYVRGAREAGQPEPAASLKGRVGKQATAMLTAHPASVLLTAARNMGAAGWNDLAVQIQRDAAAQRPRGSSNMDDHAALIRRLDNGHNQGEIA